MAFGNLNSLSIERAHRFGGPVLLSDGDGLYFRKQTREGAAWMFRYRFAGRERWMTLGNYPDMSLAAARIEAREKRLMLDKRRDPLLAQVRKSAPTAANDLLRFMRRVFRFGVRRHVLTSNPVADFDQSDAGGPERARKRALSVEELAKLLKALRESPSFGGANLLAVKLLLALGVRKSELLGAQWNEFDLDSASPTWRLPASRTKTGEALTIPLVPAVASWLKSLRELHAVAPSCSPSAGATRASACCTSVSTR